VAGLRVASRVASFRYSGKRVDITEIGKKLKVDAVLEGSVRQFGEHLRITAQLINSADGYHLWTRQYDRQRKDLFDIQEDIANRIVGAMSLTLRHHHLRDQHEVDPLAYDFFLRGRYYFAKCNAQNSIYARQMFTRAVEKDPGYGRAWAWLAYAHGFEYMYFDASDANRTEARRTSAMALALAPDLAESHIAAGIAHCMNRKCKKAGRRFVKAIELDPKKYEAWYFYARTRIRDGDPHQALELLQKASQVRPEDYQSVLLQPQLHVSLGATKRAMEASREGVAKARATLEFNPDDNRALNLGAPALLRLGEKDEAIDWMQTSVARAPGDPIVLYNAACFYALSGDVEKALDSLKRCFFKAGTINPDWLENDSDLDNIRMEPGYADIVSRVPSTGKNLSGPPLD
jgi:adenylate cyclase